MTLDEKLMREAIALSRSATKKGNEPFGAVLVKGGEIVYKSENEIYTRSDPTWHAEAGLSPYAYLSDLRIRRACELLRKGEKSIFEIAEAVGLDYRNFSRVFKAKVGQCPKDYRTEERKKRGYFTK